VVSIDRPVGALDDVQQVGAWWNRDASRQYDVVAADATGERIVSIGSIRWRERSPFGQRELHDLAEGRGVVPRAGGAGLLAICPGGVGKGVRPDLTFTPDELLGAWVQG
jgi:hypothetical protein